MSNYAQANCSTQLQLECRTFTYKRIQDEFLRLDVYAPRSTPQYASDTSETIGRTRMVPALVYFHGGGLTVGNRQSWFPRWLCNRISAAGCAFISADHRLIPPSTGHEILQDVKDVFQFVSGELNHLLYQDDQNPGQILQIDAKAIAVAGTSAGGLCAYLAAVHAKPKPKAVLSMYGMGGDLLTPHYFSPKAEIFFRGRELLDPDQFSEYLYPSSQLLQPISDSASAYQPETSSTPGFPANPRMLLARLYLQQGVYMDYYTGCHGPSLSAVLRGVAARAKASSQGTSGPTHEGSLEIVEMIDAIPKLHLPLFPQFSVTADWPPTFLVHGSADSAVLVDESQHLHLLLERVDVDVMLRVLADEEHSFDYREGAEGRYGGETGLFDEEVSFLTGHMINRDERDRSQ